MLTLALPLWNTDGTYGSAVQPNRAGSKTNPFKPESDALARALDGSKQHQPAMLCFAARKDGGRKRWWAADVEGRGEAGVEAGQGSRERQRMLDMWRSKPHGEVLPKRERAP